LRGGREGKKGKRNVGKERRKGKEARPQLRFLVTPLNF